jgi:DHA2 family methylenomycin A resistance protein-like MFS transporter
VVAQLDVTIVNIALPSMAQSLSIDRAGLQWVVDAYTLALAVFMLSAGAFGDRFGARLGFQVGLLIFGLASVGCGLADNSFWLNGSRALQGLGAAAMIPNSLALLNHRFAHDPSQRARAIGWWTAAGGISIACGPVLGGVILQALGWRAIFFVNVPLCALGLVLALRLEQIPGAARGRGFDVAGQISAAIALTALIASIIECRNLGVASPLLWSGIAVAVFFGAAFLLIEQRSKDPMIPMALFRIRAFTGSIVFGKIVNFTYYGIIFGLSFYLQQVLGYSAMATGLAFLPLTAGFFFSNVVSGRLVAAYGPRMPMVLGAAIDACAFALLLSISDHSSYRSLLPPFILIPVGMGLAVPAMTSTVLSAVDKRQSGIASAVLNTARQAAGAFGVAIFGALVSGDADHIVDGLRISSAISAALLALGLVIAWTMHPKRRG